MKRLRAEESTTARSVEFAILTAARTGDVLGAVWREIDLVNKLWALPAERTKGGRPHTVPLSDRAIEILKAAKPEKSAPNQPVFLNGSRGLSNMAGPMMLRRMNANATLHGFRSSFRDWVGDCTDFPREVAEAALAHTLTGVEAAYRRGDALGKRAVLMKAWASYCAGEATPPLAAEA